MQNYKNIKWKYLSLLFVLFAIIFSGRFYFDYIHHQDMLSEKTLELEKDIKNRFLFAEQSLVDKYTLLNLNITQNTKISELFEQKDRIGLYESLKSSYESFKRLDKYLYVMHLFDTKNVTVLRMHKPDSYNDDLTIKRPIVAKVNNSVKAQNAFEVGKNGIVYRITSPYIVNNKHIGVLEFGIYLNYFADLIDNEYDIESEILVKNKYLKTLSEKKNFQKIDEYSIISQSDFFKKLSDKIDISKNRQIIQDGKKYYILLTNLNLNNYINQDIAKIVVAKDITKYIENNNHSMLLVNFMTLTIFLFISILLYVIFTIYVDDLNKSIRLMNLLEKKSEYLEKRANRDNLTKTFNKTYMNKYLKNFLEQKRDGIILFLDIDHFKECNDTHGHLVGDEILVELAKTIQRYLRNEDLFVRWGGEEFIILFENIAKDIAIKKAEKLRKIIEDAKLVNDISTTISIGMTKIKKDDDINSLVKRADTLLYRAKRDGRNRVVYEM
ncbi:MAG: diguanylate cyclase [Thiovulaceae bacterium]|nr:diguanylate cyclase [Sulfurimonadaceae bacterium]